MIILNYDLEVQSVRGGPFDKEMSRFYTIRVTSPQIIGIIASRRFSCLNDIDLFTLLKENKELAKEDFLTRAKKENQRAVKQEKMDQILCSEEIDLNF